VLVCLLGFTVGVYVVVVLGAGLVAASSDRPGLALSVLATAVVALGIEPARRRLEAIAGRRSATSDSPYDVLRRFSEDVTGSGTASDVPVRMAQVLAQGVDADWAQVWLSVGDRLVPAATWPAGAASDPAPPLSAPAGSELLATGRRELTVRSGGRVYGVLRLQVRPGSSLTSIEERLVDGLAAQSGPVLRLIGLQAELAARRELLQQRADELRRSRTRLVEAQDDERRRLERDIHDGAQQHLVALAVNLRLAQTVAVRDPDRATTVLADQADAARDALRTLEELSRGIHPALLTNAGLVAALRDALRGSPLPVEVLVGPDDGEAALPTAVETALYFVVMEAVQNAGKHAGARRTVVRLSLSSDLAEAVVADDGVGFDPGSDRGDVGGAGLANMRDRLDVVGGRLSVSSTPGGGTIVTATVPTGTSGYELPRPRAGR